METARRDLSLIDFGMGVLGGLRLHQVSLLSDRSLPAFHAAFKAAYDTIEQEFDRSELRFHFILDQMHGTTPHVDDIVNYWLSSSYVTRDSPGPIIRLTGFNEHEARRLLETVPGDEEVWYRAGSDFLKSFRGYI